MLGSGRSVTCCVIFLYTWMHHHAGQAQPVSKSLRYAQENQTSILPLVPKRLISSSWTGVSDALTCARRSLSMFPGSRGFLYNRTSALCSPVLWLEGPSAPGALAAQSEEGDLYLSPGVCGDGFQVMAFGSAGDLACLRHENTTLVTQMEASSNCSAWGAHLVSVKTVAKLQLIRDIATFSTWVGFVFLEEQGIHLWTGDGETVTSQQIQDVFLEGEPNNLDGVEYCGQFYFEYLELNDVSCIEKFHYICEKDLPVLDE
ncbi:hypothetical protein RRG08_010034 [Elysia crispata]|uniref:C-type lectin domain-containing protein n=1 Tax=Elysia crispata TaxID=231223 RepID=A0AAE1CQY0_9GAST|nr:hypothetical protein RRG08_010034 [Elysia crispata]